MKARKASVALLQAQVPQLQETAAERQQLALELAQTQASVKEGDSAVSALKEQLTRCARGWLENCKGERRRRAMSEGTG